MTVTTSPIVKDSESPSIGILDSAKENFFADFIQSKSNRKEVAFKEDMNDFINTFICHLIFYAVFCVSLVLHILIDLKLAFFMKKLLFHFFFATKNLFFEKKLAFA
tara:strand:- start:5917 stop:6234 length:318 start_codon:yes stop_codon:yes gene_type:complete